MHSFTVLLGLAFSLPAIAAPTSQGPSLYQVNGSNVQSTNETIVGQIQGKPMVPYHGSFWFGLSTDHLCDAPQPGEGTSFSCSTNDYRPLYTLDGELELATTYVTDRISKASSGQITYEFASAMGGWSQTADGILSYNGDSQFYVCPEQRGDAPVAWQVWHDSKDSQEQGSCVGLNLKAVAQANANTSALPYGYAE